MDTRPAPHSTGNCNSCTRHNGRLFCNLGTESLTALESIASSARYSHGVTIFREGDQPKSVYILCSGRVKLSVTSREGRTMILKIAQAGEVLGLGAALGSNPHEVTAEALEFCELKVIRRSDFMHFLESSPEASLHAAQCAAQEYRAAFDEACRLGLPSTSAGRLARLFLEWSDARRKQGQQHESFPLSLTHEELAGLTATTRETITRTIAQFKRDGLITIKGVSLTILQPKMLQQMAA